MNCETGWQKGEYIYQTIVAWIYAFQEQNKYIYGWFEYKMQDNLMLWEKFPSLTARQMSIKIWLRHHWLRDLKQVS